jgi:hypothetical protein
MSGEVGGLSDEERHLEQLLASLPVRESRINRDRTMFLAGRASGTPSQRALAHRLSRWKWPAISVCSAALGLTTGMLISGQTSTGLSSDPGVTRSAIPQRPLPDRSEAVVQGTQSSTSPVRERANRPEAIARHSLSLLDLRDRMVTDGGDDQSLPSVASVATGAKLAIGAAVGRPAAPMTYRDYIRRLPDDEGHPPL